jgi:hypothetical protein
VTKILLRTNAVVDLALGIVLLLGTWDELYSTLHLPPADEPFYAQVAGSFAVAVAYLLWVAHRNGSLLAATSLAAGVAHLLASGVAVAWLVDGKMGLSGHQDLALAGLATVFLAFAVAELAHARRSVAVLLPPD